MTLIHTQRVLIFLLAVGLGATLVYAITLRSDTQEFIQHTFATAQIDSAKRLVIIENVDSQYRSIGVRTINRNVHYFERMVLALAPDTVIERYTPVFEDGVVVGLTSEHIDPTALTPGSQALVRINIKDNGVLSAGDILLGIPFIDPTQQRPDDQETQTDTPE